MNPREYGASLLRFADSDREFWMWDTANDYGEWERVNCKECYQTAVASMGGILHECDSGHGIEKDSAEFYCIEHLTERVSTDETEIKNLVTLALFENGVAPDVIADIITQLDTSLPNAIPECTIVKEEA
jgi:hypothetical protein